MVTIEKSKAGLYQGTYNFENDTEGDVPTGWAEYLGGSGRTVAVRTGRLTPYHYKIVEVSTGGTYEACYQTFTAGIQTEGTVEFYIQHASEMHDDRRVLVYIGQSTTSYALIFGIRNSKWVYTTDLTNFTQIGAEVPEQNKWYHISIDFDSVGGYDPKGDGALAADKWRVYIDGTEYGDYDTHVDDNIDTIGLYVYSGAGKTTYGYFDAIGYSWDGDYDIDDNLSLEESYDTMTNTNISQLILHHPTTLKPTSVRFGKDTYSKYYPVCVAQISADEDISLGTLIKITDNITSNSATASEVIFKGEVVKKLFFGNAVQYLIFSNAKEMDSIFPTGEYTKDTDGYISDILSNDCSKLTEGTLSDGADLGTFTAGGDKSFTSIIKACAKMDGFVAYIDSSAGASNANLMYNDGSTDTGVNIDESTSYLRGLRKVEQIDEHINKMTVRGGIKSNGARATDDYEDTTSQGLYGVVPAYDSDTTLTTDAQCLAKATALLASKQYGLLEVVIGYQYSTEGMLQPGETVTFDWDSSVKNIGFDIPSDQYVIAHNAYDVKNSMNILSLMSVIYYGPQDTEEKLEETSHIALQNSDNISANTTNIAACNYLEYDDDDPAANDITQADLTIDGAWHECDLDSYKSVPSGAIGAIFKASCKDNTVSMLFRVRHTSQSNVYQAHAMRTQVANLYNDSLLFAPLDANNKFDYYVDNGMDNVALTVLWWVREH